MSHYEVLGVSSLALEAEIKKAFRKLSLRYHPDKTDKPSDHELFLRIKEAYETLSNPTLRAAFDRTNYTAPRQPTHTYELPFTRAGAPRKTDRYFGGFSTTNHFALFTGMFDYFSHYKRDDEHLREAHNERKRAEERKAREKRDQDRMQEAIRRREAERREEERREAERRSERLRREEKIRREKEVHEARQKTFTARKTPADASTSEDDAFEEYWRGHGGNSLDPIVVDDDENEEEDEGATHESAAADPPDAAEVNGLANGVLPERTPPLVPESLSSGTPERVAPFAQDEPFNLRPRSRPSFIDRPKLPQRQRAPKPDINEESSTPKRRRTRAASGKLAAAEEAVREQAKQNGGLREDNAALAGSEDWNGNPSSRSQGRAFAENPFGFGAMEETLDEAEAADRVDMDALRDTLPGHARRSLGKEPAPKKFKPEFTSADSGETLHTPVNRRLVRGHKPPLSAKILGALPLDLFLPPPVPTFQVVTEEDWSQYVVLVQQYQRAFLEYREHVTRYQAARVNLDREYAGELTALGANFEAYQQALLADAQVAKQFAEETQKHSVSMGTFEVNWAWYKRMHT